MLKVIYEKEGKEYVSSFQDAVAIKHYNTEWEVIYPLQL